MNAKQLITELLEVSRSGIVFNGPNPWDIEVKDERLYDRVIREGSIGFGEAYMDHWWECRDIAELFNRIVSARMYEYYLLQCAGGFRSRGISVVQVVLSPQGVPGGYQTVR